MTSFGKVAEFAGYGPGLYVRPFLLIAIVIFSIIVLSVTNSESGPVTCGHPITADGSSDGGGASETYIVPWIGIKTWLNVYGGTTFIWIALLPLLCFGLWFAGITGAHGDRTAVTGLYIFFMTIITLRGVWAVLGAILVFRTCEGEIHPESVGNMAIAAAVISLLLEPVFEVLLLCCVCCIVPCDEKRRRDEEDRDNLLQRRRQEEWRLERDRRRDTSEWGYAKCHNGHALAPGHGQGNGWTCDRCAGGVQDGDMMCRPCDADVCADCFARGENEAEAPRPGGVKLPATSLKVQPISNYGSNA